MGEEKTIERREIMEERGNRHALYICFGLIFLLALLIAVLGIAAYNSRFMLMPLVPREQLPPITKPTIQQLYFHAARSQPAEKDLIASVPRAEDDRRHGIVFRGAWQRRGGSASVTTPAASLAPECNLAAGSISTAPTEGRFPTRPPCRSAVGNRRSSHA